jgi:DNA-directed RNA polymerase subunit M/transcription elongation factor TFIIS
MERASERQPGFLVYLSGVGTSALALYGVRVLNNHGEYIMGWYANGIIPAGALLVGMVSGLGFAVASRVLHVRLTRSYVLGMIATGILDYVAATYLTYQTLLEEHHVTEAAYSFFQYAQDIAEKMSFSHGSPLGKFGYLYKLLEIAGFSLGTMMPAAVLFKMPFCVACQKYLVTHKKGFLSSAATRDAAVSTKQTRAAREAAIRDANNEMARSAVQLATRMRGAPLADVVAALEEDTEAAKNKAAAATVLVHLKKCPRCEAHHVSFQLESVNLDKKRTVTVLPAVDATGAPSPAAIAS